MGDELSIHNDILPGDMGSIVKMHGEYYGRNYGYDHTFEPPLSEFVLRNSEKERIWLVKEKGLVKGCVAVTKYKKRVARLRWYIQDESLQGQVFLRAWAGG